MESAHHTRRRDWLLRSGRGSLGLGALLCGLAPASRAATEDWPSRPITIVVPNPAGSATDTMARLAADALGAAGRQPVVVDNKPGAQGVIGVQAMKQGKPDGHTLIVSFSGLNSSYPWLAKTPRYHHRDDFTHIVPLVRAPSLLVVRADAPYRTLAELLAAGRADPAKLVYGYGQATSQVMGGAFCHAGGFAAATGVPYRGQPQALTDLVGGRFDFMFADLSVTKPFVDAGKLRALGISTKARADLVPDMPTLAEQGVAGYDLAAWVGLSGPAGMAPGIAARINDTVARHMATPAVRARIRQLGFTPLQGSPAEFSAFAENEYQLWGRAIQAAKIEPE